MKIKFECEYGAEALSFIDSVIGLRAGTYVVEDVQCRIDSTGMRIEGDIILVPSSPSLKITGSKSCGKPTVIPEKYWPNWIQVPTCQTLRVGQLVVLRKRHGTACRLVRASEKSKEKTSLVLQNSRNGWVVITA